MPHKPDPLLEGQQTKTITLRLPIEMYLQIRELATNERRSLVDQILFLLDRVLAPHGEEREQTV